jgi:FlaA1/EpsC-like NDP-sugar epimerase
MQKEGTQPSAAHETTRRGFPLLARFRGPIQLGLDLVVWLAAINIAAWLRFDFDLAGWDRQRLAMAWVVAAVAQTAIGYAFGLYRGRWRFGSFDEIAALTWTTTGVGLGLYVACRYAFQPRLVPSSVTVGGTLVALLGMAAVRYVWRMAIDRQLRPSAESAEPVLIFGAGEVGCQLVASMLRNPESLMYPVGILDDDPSKKRLTVRGIPVVGTRDDMSRAAQRLGARRLVIAAPSGDAKLFQALSQGAIAAGLQLSVLPGVDELVGPDGDYAHFTRIRPLDVRDLLGRHEIQTDIEQIAGYISGRRVLVTGAGGSIGSELCAQLSTLAPAELIMLDRDESALHGLQLRLEGKGSLSDRNLVVADIRDRERLAEVFDEHRPEVVFHAAALKHVPLLEMYPSEGVKTNVYGTLNLLELAAEQDVDRFVNVSTDKAADPQNVLGFTKRIAERLTAHFAEQTKGTFLSVRFGNVLGSRGSVLETFQAQIAAGGPVTVVHPEVTRYFMTVEEAVQLVIQAGAIGNDGEALVLDMGTPVRIDDVARQLIAASQAPIEIKYTGLRPGEKLHEVLISKAEIGVSASHPLITHVEVPVLCPQELSLYLQHPGSTPLSRLFTICGSGGARFAPHRRTA